MYLKLKTNHVISSMLGLGSLMFFLLFVYFSLFNKSVLLDFEILNFNSKSICMCIYLDWMSSSFMSFVLLISFVVTLYSISYMGSEKSKSFFIIMVFMFVLSMMLLIISPNLISILLGWDGLGLTSYCLVIYYQNIKSYNAGMVTAMTNRIGDVMILLGIAWMLNFGSWNYLFYFEYEKALYSIIGLLIILAAMTKSAQIPFSSWLPAAMAAPTPVSALVHSSTLVTAGVYLLIRFSPIFENYELCSWLLLISVLTMFMSGLGAIFETDLKKIIALSTLSQLGLMISSLCLGLTNFAFFHLMTHALFKSLLFMCAGYIIHGMKDSQDVRFMGCIISQSPVLSIYFNISNLALCGMPFLAGFYSKDVILESILMNMTNMIIFVLYFVATFFTVVYTFRLVYLSMINNLKLSSYFCYSDNDFMMLGPMVIMLMMVILGGGMMNWMIFLDLEGIFLPTSLKMMTLLICFLGVVSGVFIGKNNNLGNTVKSNSMNYFEYMAGGMWFLPYLSTYSINYIGLQIGYYYYKVIDLGWGEKIGGQGLFKLLFLLNSNILVMQKKNIFMMIYFYIMFMIVLLIMF
uniref:NADH-ubiquinone oxidoreductase chain 5 n=1 Tax=Kilauella sp. KispEL TaxID=1940902 RepID=A0A8K1ZFR6_9NEOP|nr:NADH dehydrogenase subunit 5 [Kilauella sp. KispEL]